MVSATRAGLSPASRDSVSYTPIATPPNTTTGASAREQFNTLLISRLEEMRHSVCSQVMQQLELHAAGSLKNTSARIVDGSAGRHRRDIAQGRRTTSTRFAMSFPRGGYGDRPTTRAIVQRRCPIAAPGAAWRAVPFLSTQGGPRSRWQNSFSKTPIQVGHLHGNATTDFVLNTCLDPLTVTVL